MPTSEAMTDVLMPLRLLLDARHIGGLAHAIGGWRLEIGANSSLLNTYSGLTFPVMASATATFLFRQFFLTVPDELSDAARIDGTGPLRFLVSILLPLSAANLAALGIIFFLVGWNQHLWPLLFTTEAEMQTIVVGIRQLVIHPTSDGRLAVIHDATLERTTEGTGAVAARSATALDAIRLRGTAEGVPMLDEVRDIPAPSALELHIELKADADGHAHPGLEAQVVGEIFRRGLSARTVLTSFWLPVLAALRDTALNAHLLASLDARSVERQGGPDDVLDKLDRLQMDLVSVCQDLLAERWQDFVARVPADRHGACLVNRPKAIARWRQAPIGQITTDRPDLFRLAPP